MRNSVAAKASKEYSILQQFPRNTLNNTTVHTLGNTAEPLEVFPPEIYFKGMFHLSYLPSYMNPYSLIFVAN